MISKTTSSSLFSSFFIVLGLMSSEFLHLLLFSDFWFLKSSLFSESLRKVVQRLKVFFFFSVALPARPFWKDTNMNLNVHFVCICYVCMNRYLSRRQFSYAPMDVLSSFRSIFTSPILFSFSTASSFAAISPPLCLQTAQRNQCENLFVKHLLFHFLFLSFDFCSFDDVLYS